MNYFTDSLDGMESLEVSLMKMIGDIEHSAKISSHKATKTQREP